MARQISISDTAYTLLLKVKGSGSFSDAIISLFNRNGQGSQKKELMKYFGMWKTKETGVEYTRRMRSGWEKRTRGIYGRSNV